LTLADLEEIDKMTVIILEDLKTIQDKMTEEEFLQGESYELFFTTILSNGEEVELCHGGRSKRVTFANLKDYLSKTLHARL